jgi:hypothetical protein
MAMKPRAMNKTKKAKMMRGGGAVAKDMNKPTMMRGGGMVNKKKK